MALKKDKTVKRRFYIAVVLSAVLMYVLTLAVANFIHTSSTQTRYKNLCKSVIQTVNGLIADGDMEAYINDRNSYNYIQLDQKLDGLKQTIPGIHIIGIYLMTPEGMGTVFTTENVGAGGSVITKYDSHWQKYRESFLNNEVIENAYIITDAGPAIAYCQPVLSRDNYSVYLCTSVLKERIDGENMDFLKSIVIALAGVILVILLGVFVLINVKIVNPLKKIGGIVYKAADTEESDFIDEITENYVKAGNEIENICRSLLNIYTQKTRLASSVKKADKENVESFVWLLQRMDVLNSAHLDNFLEYIMLLLAELKEDNKYAEQITRSMYGNILLAAPLHDVGKLVIPEEIVNKPGKLTDEEFELMKKHCEYGGAIISDMYASHINEGYLEYAREIALHHHEKWDGTGYPHGLKGEEIPLYVRIVTIATVFDTLVSERPYSRAFSFKEAMKVLVSEKGKLFDPDLVDVFVKSKDKVYNIYEKNKENK